jgi:hypothetical protein
MTSARSRHACRGSSAIGVSGRLPVHLALLRQRNLGHARERPRIGEAEHAVSVLLDGHRLGQRPRALRVAEREVVVLDGEDVREVRADLEGDLDLEPPARVVLDHDVLLHPVADEALPGDRELVVLEPAGRGVAKVERRREVVHAGRREPQRLRAVHRQDPAREEAGVVREEPGRRRLEVADVVRDAERRALEDRERRHYYRRTMASWARLLAGLDHHLVGRPCSRAGSREEDAISHVGRVR